jgi:THO complex subunit 2
MGLLSNLNKLHHSEEAWKKNNIKNGIYLPGFQRAWTGKDKLDESDLLSWSDFKMLNKKWHKKLAGVRNELSLCNNTDSTQTLSQCLSSDEYIHIHNAIVILKEVLEEFPISSVNTATGNWIYTTIESCHSNEKRQDLQILIAS